MPIAEATPAGPSSTAPGRLRGLLEAHRLITSEPSLATVLSLIVESACRLVGASSGVLRVISPDGAQEHLVQHGTDDETAARISAYPGPRGTARSLYLQVPIEVRGELFGELHLATPEGGRFSVEDEELIDALVAVAGTAVANARLYEDARRSRDWLNASGEIARALLAEADVDLLMEVVSRALHVAEADYGALVLPTEDGRFRVAVTVGRGAEEFQDLVFTPESSPMGRAMLSGQSLLLSDMTLIAKPEFENIHGFGPVMLAPLVDAKGLRGAVVLMRTQGSLGFTPRELDLATTFADQVALALDLDDARADAEWLRVLEDRHRIAQDLHDNVMQRLFATGMGLQGLAASGLPADLEERLSRHITDLDETIDEIRTRVFGLRSADVRAAIRPPRRFPRVDGTAGPPRR
ncbi:MAG TPA: GAF domain-containing protein [Jatrophihabitans sp.]|jgi:GAF domain-containing protein|uniref:sensor histidine kinase n=1 Tax=Jatrophihabitans sp. TaxID=1932789 RepID=UPI002DFF532E|nr:GAF domain-containing protein [Jatrophihabitans sp.]